MNATFSLIVLLMAHPLYSFSKPAEAVCSVPVADLLSQKLSITGQQTLEQQYALLPFSEKQPAAICCRATQLLFNERVTVIEQSGEQSYIEASFWYLKNPSFQRPSTRNNRFWTLTKNLKFIEKITSEENAAIPPTAPEESLEKMITLFLPWHCRQTSTTYSAGTRFVLTRQGNSHYHITIYNPQTSKVVETTVPKRLCVLNKKRTDKEKRELFLTTLQCWARGIPYAIPYVLGGASILETCKDASFYEKKMMIGKIKGTIFIRPECTKTPHTGVDCAGLIRLACKIAGISLTATNSKSIAQSFFKLEPTTSLQNGDIIFFKGHIAVISDAKKGFLLEARGYEHGYGVVQEIPYRLELQEIDTTDNLVNSYRIKKPIQRLDKHGRHRETITDLTIFSLLPVKPTPWIT